MQRSVENELLAAIRRLEKRVAEQDVLIAAKDKQIEELEAELAKLKKNSGSPFLSVTLRRHFIGT